MHRIAPPITLVLRPSIVIRAAVWALLTMAAAALHLSQLPDVSILVLLPLAWFSLWHASGGLPMTLILHGDGAVERIDGSAHPHSIQLLALHERGPLGVLVLEIDGRRQGLPWAADSLPRALRRDLRLWMRDHVRVTEPKTALYSPKASSPE